MTWASDFSAPLELSELVSMIGIGMSAIIAILLYILGRKINDTQRIGHINSLQNEIENMLSGAKGRDIELYNSKLYTSTNFAKNTRSRLWGYSCHGAGLRGYDFEGVEFMVELVKWHETKFYRVGVIPYERILKIRQTGDGSTNKPILFVKPYLFQKDKYSIAYKKFVYYPLNAGPRVHPPLSFRINALSKRLFLKISHKFYYRWRKK